MASEYARFPFRTRARLTRGGDPLYNDSIVIIEFLGTGTSHGIPVIGCSCPVCQSADPRDARYRSSIWVRGSEGASILVDSGPEFRLQALRAGIRRLDAVLLTHAHADHLHGLDDLRPLTREAPLPVWANEPTIRELEERFSYVFRETQIGGGKPRFDLHRADAPFTIGGITVTPIPVKHGNLDILGWLFEEDGKRAAYISDVSFVTDAVSASLKDCRLDILILDALREKPHSTHFSYREALEFVDRVSPARSYVTHLCHEHSHAEATAWFMDHRPLTGSIEVACDGLVVEP